MPDIDKIREEVEARSTEVDSVDLEELERAATESEDPSFLIEVSSLYQERNQIEDALRVLDKAEEFLPDSDEAELKRADIHYCTGDKDRAVALWETLADSGNGYDSACARINLAYHRGQFNDAINQYEKLSAAYVKASPKYFADILVPCYLNTKRFAEAKTLCVSMLQLKSNKLGYLGMLGIAEDRLGNLDVAGDIYETVLKIDPYETMIVGRLLRVHIIRFQWRAAWRVFSEYVKKHVDKPE